MVKFYVSLSEWVRRPAIRTRVAGPGPVTAYLGIGGFGAGSVPYGFAQS